MILVGDMITRISQLSANEVHLRELVLQVHAQRSAAFREASSYFGSRWSIEWSIRIWHDIEPIRDAKCVQGLFKVVLLALLCHSVGVNLA